MNSLLSTSALVGVLLAVYPSCHAADAPVVVIARTIKGKGVSFMEGRYEWHGKAPNDREFELAMREIEA